MRKDEEPSVTSSITRSQWSEMLRWQLRKERREKRKRRRLEDPHFGKLTGRLDQPNPFARYAPVAQHYQSRESNLTYYQDTSWTKWRRPK